MSRHYGKFLQRIDKTAAFDRRLNLVGGNVGMLLADDLPLAAAIAELLANSGHFEYGAEGLLFGLGGNCSGLGVHSPSDIKAITRYLLDTELSDTEAADVNRPGN